MRYLQSSLLYKYAGLAALNFVASIRNLQIVRQRSYSSASNVLRAIMSTASSCSPLTDANHARTRADGLQTTVDLVP